MLNNPFQLMEDLDHAIDELENRIMSNYKSNYLTVFHNDEYIALRICGSNLFEFREVLKDNYKAID